MKQVAQAKKRPTREGKVSLRAKKSPAPERKPAAKSKKAKAPADPLPETRRSSFPPSVRPGIPRLGPTPRGWRRVKFSDVLEIVSRPVKLRDDREYQLVTAKRSRGGIVPRERLRGRDIRVKQQFRIEAGDFIISRRQIVHGACGFVPPELAGATVSGEYDVFRLKPGVTSQFFAYFTHTDYFQKSCYFSSVGVALEKMVFNLPMWLGIEFDLPPANVQESIVTALRAVDKCWEVTLAAAEQQRKLTNVVRRRLIERGSANGSRLKLKPSLCGLVPAHWDVVRVGDAGMVQLGRQRSPDKMTGTCSMPYLRVANVHDGWIDYSDVLEMDFTQAEREIFGLKAGDILLNEGQSIELVGRSATYDGKPNQFCFQNTLIRFRCNERSVPSYVQAVFKEFLDSRQFQRVALQTTSIAHLGADRLAKMWMPLPPLKEQRVIGDAIASLTAAARTDTAFVREMSLHRDRVISKLIGGRQP